MHNNYYFLKKLTKRLGECIIGWKLGEIFSQNKDELIIGVYGEKSQLYIKAHLTSQFSCLSFTEAFQRAKKNSVDLFSELINQEIKEVNLNEFDRSFNFITSTHTLVFKLHGNRSNILLFSNKAQHPQVFKNQLHQDKSLTLSDLKRTLELSKTRFLEVEGDLFQYAPVLGKEIQQLVASKQANSPEAKWRILEDVLQEVEDDNIYIAIRKDLPELLLFDPGLPAQVFLEPIAAINYFFQQYISQLHLTEEKKRQVKSLSTKIKRAENYIQKNRHKLHELQSKRRYDQIADVIMANLHQIKSNVEKATLYDFYSDTTIDVPLKRHLSPQKNAELYYRKAKNQNIEARQLEENIKKKEQELLTLQKDLERTQNSNSLKALKKQSKSTTAGNILQSHPAYKKYEYKGFDILLGRGAGKNDELTFKVANKDDLWLHAKDTKGSHVVIRHKAGHNIPENVLEKAASLAAWHSKRRTEQYVPVTFTPRKFIRKTKDLAAGQVIVEKEQVVLVPPEDW